MDDMDFDFATYFQIWANQQRWKIPQVHFDIIRFLEDGDWKIDTKVLLLWRGVGKSTIVDLWVAYKLSKDPTLRFLIISADFETSKKSSQDILFITRNHPLSTHLISETNETRKDSFYVNGHSDQRNPSVRGVGALGNVTGGRCDYLIFDDAEVKKNSGSEAKRTDLRRNLAEATNLLTPEHGKMLFIGTYHDPISIYDERIEDGASYLKVPMIDKAEGDYPKMTGKSNWPSRFNKSKVAAVQKSCGSKSEFYSQYLLVPTGIEDSLLDPSLCKIYQDDINIRSANGETVATIGDHVIKSVSAWWDPAMSGARQDDSVLAIVFTCTHGNLFVHRTIKLVGDADAQCIQARDYLKRFNVPLLKIEANTIGAFLPQLMIKHLAGTGIGAKGVKSTQNKNEKIVESLETPLYGGYLYISEQVKNGKFLGQMRDFDPTSNRNKDDYIDSVSSAIKEEPVRVAGRPVSMVDGINTKWLGSEPMDIQRDKFKL